MMTVDLVRRVDRLRRAQLECELRPLCPQSRFLGCMIINNASTGRMRVLHDLLDTGVHDSKVCDRRCPMIEPLIDILTILPMPDGASTRPCPVLPARP